VAVRAAAEPEEAFVATGAGIDGLCHQLLLTSEDLAQLAIVRDGAVSLAEAEGALAARG
jgi:hypothetical protein